MALSPDYKIAALKLYSIVALNETPLEDSRLYHKTQCAEILASQLNLHDPKTAKAWLRGIFDPTESGMSPENFIRFVRLYKGKQWLETDLEITELARNIYGTGYANVLFLLGIDETQQLAQHNLASDSEAMPHIQNPLAREIFGELLKRYQMSNDGLYTALSRIQIPEIPLVNNEIKCVLEYVISRFSDTELYAFAFLGALHPLESYSYTCLSALWGCDDLEFDATVSLFVEIKILKPVGVKGWTINHQILRVAETHLFSMGADLQRQARSWYKRALADNRVKLTFESTFERLDVSGNQLLNFGTLQKTRQNESVNNYKKRVSLWKKLLSVLLDLRHEQDWEDMKSFLNYLSGDNFLYAQYLIERGAQTIKVAYSMLFVLFLWAIPIFVLENLVGIKPRILQIIFILIVSMLMMIPFFKELYKEDINWRCLWEEIIPRIRGEEKM